MIHHKTQSSMYVQFTCTVQIFLLTQIVKPFQDYNDKPYQTKLLNPKKSQTQLRKLFFLFSSISVSWLRLKATNLICFPDFLFSNQDFICLLLETNISYYSVSHRVFLNGKGEMWTRSSNKRTEFKHLVDLHKKHSFVYQFQNSKIKIFLTHFSLPRLVRYLTQIQNKLNETIN